MVFWRLEHCPGGLNYILSFPWVESCSIFHLRFLPVSSRPYVVHSLMFLNGFKITKMRPYCYYKEIVNNCLYDAKF